MITEAADIINGIDKDIMIKEERLESLRKTRAEIVAKYSELERVFDIQGL